MKQKDLLRKIRYAIYIPRGVSKRPKHKKAVISDLFCIRNDENWSTYFEGLNLSGLIQGDNSQNSTSETLIIYFDKDGDEINRKIFALGQTARTTIKLEEDFLSGVTKAATFAIFHLVPDSFDLGLGTSHLAERGYVGFTNGNSNVRGYVHGNLDAIGYHQDKIQMLGNQGFLTSKYTVQHELRGPAVYELFIVNPCRRSTKIEILVRIDTGKWEGYRKLRLKPRGSRIVSIPIAAGESRMVRIKSHLYLGRPVVFRKSEFSFDVFHG